MIDEFVIGIFLLVALGFLAAVVLIMAAVFVANR